MSYNGIGLPTPRGTGTNGYIQRNLANVYKSKSGKSEGKQFAERRRILQQKKQAELRKKKAEFVDTELLEHEEKRRLEVKVMEYRDYLEDQLEEEEEEGNEDEKMREIDAKVEKYREKLIARAEKRGNDELERRKKAEERAEKLKHASYGIKVDPFSKGSPESDSEK
ncbi:CWC21 [Brettanomyces bruxellensis]|uniref:Pre-mRNA-splicing factor CWC21 n=1 Tax=Dekkera bruxellensis TaxID=5007 RepID=A0A7D9CXN1_DEKBR|nr:CWC21 [Brettanomyces bruxellensis]